ncbi:pyridoxal phosphate-dependent transferase [Fusarium acuminatum]|uniref:Pyridoxal phosphate-dependent transferase n=1 Tax=Fusarium acuminatum TaxID=5515 RepID=A0ABZ2X0E6_9HYPO
MEPENVFVHFYCGLHVDPCRNNWSGPDGMIRSILVQIIAALVDKDLLDLSFLNRRSFIRGLENHDTYTLCHLLHDLVQQFDPDTTIYCFIDGVSRFDVDYRGTFGLLKVIIDRIEGIVEDDSLKPKLKKLAPNTNTTLLDPDLPLSYGTTLGSVRLRERIAELHSSPEVELTAANVVITPGSSMANHLVLATLCGPGDHIICQYPTYGPLYLLPKHSGVDVSLWELKEAEGWSLDLKELANMIKPNTKVIIICNPNNPTGTIIPRDTLEQVLGLAQKNHIVVFSDEVFSPLFHTKDQPPPLVSLGYPHTLSTGSLSKAYALPGIRIGWVVSQDKEIIRQVSTLRDYTTISVSLLDDSVGAFALSKEVLPRLMERNLRLFAESITLLDGFVRRNAQRCRWTKPKGSGVAFVQILNKDGSASDDLVFSKKLVEEAGITVLPGSYSFAEEGANNLKGYLRIEIGSPERLREGLVAIEEFLHKYDFLR